MDEVEVHLLHSFSQGMACEMELAGVMVRIGLSRVMGEIEWWCRVHC